MIGTSVAHYRIIEKLGAGGMGEVYLAQDTKLERRVALKFLSAALRSDPEARIRLLREAKAASRLNHPNILTIHAVEEIDGRDFIVMEYVAGETLSQWMRGVQRTEQDIVALIAQVASGLAHAHEAGIVHRDLKPDNILVDKDGRTKILDFGLALLSGSARMTREQITVGTAHYMSPEQVRGGSLDGRSDLWSLGAILYEVLTGELPFPGEASHAVMYSILHEEPTPVADRNPSYSKALTTVMSKCLAKDPTRRYTTGRALVLDLQTVQSQSTPSPRDHSNSTAESRPSVAVLPFANMSADPDAEYFSDGLAEEIINALTKFKELRVAARTSSFSFKGKNADVKEIGAKLGVEKVLEGSVRRAGDRLRIMAQLINVADGYHEWSERYDRQLEDVFAIQDDITRAIVERLTGELLRAQDVEATFRPENHEAHDQYLKGIYFLNQRTPDSFRRAIEHFTDAVALHPEYALAHAGLAYTYCFIAHPAWAILPPEEVLPKAKKHAQESIRLDDQLPQGWVAVGLVLSLMEWDWVEAERCLRRAIELAPELPLVHHAYADHLMFMGLQEEAIEAIRKAVILDPLSNILRLNHSTRLTFAGQFDEARRVIDEVIFSDPSYMAAYAIRAIINWAAGRFAELKQDLSRIAFLRENTSGWVSTLVGEEDSERRRQQAMRLLNEVVLANPTTPPGVVAMLYLQAGNTEEAFVWLERAFDRRDVTLMVFSRLPVFDQIRDDERFINLVKRTTDLRPPREMSAT
jgi:serine/threonine-protein kinase